MPGSDPPGLFNSRRVLQYAVVLLMAVAAVLAWSLDRVLKQRDAAVRELETLRNAKPTR
jgi:hypothetical protein